MHVVGNVSFVKTLVVVMEYCRNVDAVWTWHAIVTFIARYAVQARNMVGNILYPMESHVSCQSKRLAAVEHCEAVVYDRILLLLGVSEYLVVVIWDWKYTSVAK